MLFFQGKRQIFAKTCSWKRRYGYCSFKSSCHNWTIIYTHCMKALTWSLLNWNFLIWLRGTCEVWSKCLCNSIEIMILRIMDNVLNNYYNFSWVITDCNVGSLLGWKLQITPWKAIPEIIIMISNIVLLILKI